MSAADVLRAGFAENLLTSLERINDRMDLLELGTAAPANDLPPQPGKPGRGVKRFYVDPANWMWAEFDDGTTQRIWQFPMLQAPVSVYAPGGLGRAEVLELIEAAMPADDSSNWLHYSENVQINQGENILFTPSDPGIAFRCQKISILADPDSANTPMMTLRIGQDVKVRSGPALIGRVLREGAPGDAFIIDADAAATVGINIDYEEFAPE